MTSESRNDVLARRFGPLELRVMEALWHRDAESTVRDLEPFLPGFAYTTLMTTLDRLYKKGMLHRAKRSRAYAYVPRWRRDEMEILLAADTFEGLLGGARAATGVAPILSCFVDAVGERDRELLDELARLVDDKRRRLEKETTS